MAENHTDDFRKDVLIPKLQEYAKLDGFPDFNTAPPVVRGRSFLKFYLDEVFSQNTDLDSEQVYEEIVDGAGDTGLDYVHIDNKRVYIIQAKYGAHGKDKECLEHFINIPHHLTENSDYLLEKAKNNTAVKAVIQEIKEIKNPIFDLIYIASTNIPTEDIAHYEKDCETDCRIIGISQLRQEWEEISSRDSLAMVNNWVVLDLGGEDTKTLDTVKGYGTKLITQKGTKLKNLFEQHKEALFNSNIRLWLGKNPVNASMIETIKNNPSRFFYYNNGITAICDEWDVSMPSLLKCKNLQIINGAQTVTTIAKEGDTGQLAEVKVLLRIITGEHGKRINDEDGLNINIVKNNNNQTAVTVSDFRSNDPIQFSIENIISSKKIRYTVESPIKDVFYARKRRKDKKVPRTKTIKPQDLGKAYYSFYVNPYDLNASISKLWDTENGYYVDVFGKPSDVIYEPKFYQLVGSYYIFEYVKLKVKEPDAQKTIAAQFKYQILNGISTLLKLKYATNEAALQKLMEKIVNDGKYINQTINPNLEAKFSKYYESVFEKINMLITLKKKQNETFVLRNHLRSKQFIEELNAFLTGSTISALPDLEI